MAATAAHDWQVIYPDGRPADTFSSEALMHAYLWVLAQDWRHPTRRVEVLRRVDGQWQHSAWADLERP